MSILVFLKVFADWCLSIAVLGSFPVFFASDYGILLPALLGALGVGIAAHLSDSGKEKRRYWCVLLPMAVPLAAGSLSELLVLVPGALYCAAVILRGKLSLEYYDFRHLFQRSLIGLVIFLALVWFFSFIDTNTGGSELNFDPGAPIRFGVIYAVIGVILQRQLRLGSAMNKGVSHAQAALLLGGTGVAVGAFLALERMLEQNIQTIFMKSMEWLFFPVALLFRLFGGLIESIEGDVPPSQPTETGTTPTAGTQIIPPETAHAPALPVEPEESTPWLAVVVLIAVLLMMMVMLLAFRSRKKEKTAGAAPEAMAPEVRRDPPRRRSNRAKIRRYYRDFLKQEEKRGLKRRQDQTSLDILEELPKQSNAGAAASLREVYLHARYREQGEISPAQVEQAKAALKQSREKQPEP